MLVIKQDIERRLTINIYGHSSNKLFLTIQIDSVSNLLDYVSFPKRRAFLTTFILSFHAFLQSANITGSLV